jgi:hypothetical protein
VSAGQYQTPYQLSPNGGAFMIQAEQMFTNPAKLKAKEDYMKGMSKVTAADKNYLKNQLIAQAKQYYYERVVLEKNWPYCKTHKACSNTCSRMLISAYLWQGKAAQYLQSQSRVI